MLQHCSLTSQSFLSSRILSSASCKAWTANCHCGCCDPGCCGICKSHGCPAYGSPLASSDSSIFPFMCEVGLEQLLVRSFHMSLPSGAEARTSPKRRKGCWWTRQTLPPVRIAQETTRREGESSWWCSLTEHGLLVAVQGSSSYLIWSARVLCCTWPLSGTKEPGHRGWGSALLMFWIVWRLFCCESESPWKLYSLFLVCRCWRRLMMGRRSKPWPCRFHRKCLLATDSVLKFQKRRWMGHNLTIWDNVLTVLRQVFGWDSEQCV